MVATALVSCSPAPPEDLQAAAAALADQLGALDVTEPFGPEAQREMSTTTSGMRTEPSVTVDEITHEGTAATAVLSWSWPLSSGAWAYQSHVEYARGEEGGWTPVWRPSVVHPRLGAGSRLVHERLGAERGDVLTPDGRLVHEREVQVIGIDKPRLDPDEQGASARELARLLDIDATTYAAKVEAAGPQAFVPGLTLRGGVWAVPDGVSEIPGARAVPDELMLPPSRGFARNVLGGVREVTAEDVAGSAGELAAGDTIGSGGIQQRYDDQLRGQPGDRVLQVDGEDVGDAEELHRVDPVAGSAVTVTLDEDLQQAAEAALAGVATPAALVAVRVSDGAVLAAADGPEAGHLSISTTGRYPPGSTFKLVTSLAAIRAGVDPDASLECSPRFTVDGRSFENYDDFPTTELGPMSMVDAIAYSCNTALLRTHEEVDGASMRQAAASLGFGTDFDSGFSAFYGSAPDPANVVGRAEAMIGQGLIEASPLSMAAVAASVAGGRTVVPHLLHEQPVTPTAAELSPEETQQLRRMMEGVVDHGSARFLQGLAEGAKTGTAEYGEAVPPRTHGWMIAYRGDLAVAVLVEDGASGSASAGPVLADFLRATR